MPLKQLKVTTPGGSQQAKNCLQDLQILFSDLQRISLKASPHPLIDSEKLTRIL